MLLMAQENTLVLPFLLNFQTPNLHLQRRPGLDYLASTQAYFDDKQHFDEIRCISAQHGPTAYD